MNRSVLRLISLAWIVYLPAVGWAGDPINDAWRLYRTGDFSETEAHASAIATADSFALAARAANVRALYLVPPMERAATLKRAQKYAESALALNPAHVDGALQLVIALGHQARSMGLAEAHFDGIAEASKSQLDRIATGARANPYYHAVLGAWHGELVVRAGPTAALLFYGARWEHAAGHFETALALAPDSVIIGCEFAKMLLRHGRQLDRAFDLLSQVANASPADAAEALVIEEAAMLLASARAKAGTH